MSRPISILAAAALALTAASALAQEPGSPIDGLWVLDRENLTRCQGAREKVLYRIRTEGGRVVFSNERGSDAHEGKLVGRRTVVRRRLSGYDWHGDPPEPVQKALDERGFWSEYHLELAADGTIRGKRVSHCAKWDGNDLGDTWPLSDDVRLTRAGVRLEFVAAGKPVDELRYGQPFRVRAHVDEPVSRDGWLTLRVGSERHSLKLRPAGTTRRVLESEEVILVDGASGALDAGRAP